MRLAAIGLVGAFALPTAAPLVCELKASQAASEMDHMADAEHGQRAARVGTSTIASSCMTVAHCVTTQIGFSVARSAFESPADLLLRSATPAQAFFLGRALAPPTPPPKV